MNSTEYLKEHGLDPVFLKKKLGWDWNDSMITIPIYDENAKLLFCRYRHMSNEPKFSSDKGSHAALYGAHRIKDKHLVIFCEGEPDAAKLLQEGFSAVTAGGVKTFTAKIAKPLSDKEVVIILDNDTAGQESIQNYCEILQSIGATPIIAKLPDGVKDVCEYFNNFSKIEFEQNVINTAKYYEDWVEQNEPEEFRIDSGEDILTRELPEQAWLIERILPVDGITFIVGSEGTGKSFYTLTMADAVANGKKWLGKFDVTRNTKVLFIDKENVVRRIQGRMKGLQISGKNMYWLAYPEYFIMIDEKSDDGLSAFSQKIKRFVEKNDIGLIVIDSFTDVMIGNENAASDTQVFFDGLRQMFKDRGVLVIHHANKPSAGVVRTAAQKTRGSTNIMAQVYSAFYVEQLPQKDHEFAIEHIKAGDTEKIKKFKVEMEVHQDIYDKAKTSVIALQYRGEIIDEEMKKSQAEAIIMEALGNTPEIARTSLEALCTAQGVSTRTFQDTIKKMKEENVIDTIPDPENKSKRLVVLL